MIFSFLIHGTFLIIFGACTIILGALVAIIVPVTLYWALYPRHSGTFHSIPGIQAIILTANPLILGAFAIIFGP